MPGHRIVGAIVITIGAAATLAGTFLTWVSSGSTQRTSYEVFGLVERLGFSPDGPASWALRAWPLVPLALVLAVVVQWMRHPSTRWPRHAVTVASSVYPGATAVAVANAPEIALFDVGPGPWVTVAGAAIMLAGYAAPWAIRRRASPRASRPVDTEDTGGVKRSGA